MTAAALACALGLAIAASTVWAAAGDFDTSFSGDGKRVFAPTGGGGPLPGPNYADWANDVVIQPDGKIVVAGRAQEYGFALARLHPGGAFDSSFSGDGKRTFIFADDERDDEALAMALQPDGKIVVAGMSGNWWENTGLDFAVARLHANGSLDTSFSGDGRRTFVFAGGTVREQAEAVAVQRDGKIVVAGWSGSQPRHFAIARLRSNGNLDPSFSGDGTRLVSFSNWQGSDTASALAIQPDGKIVVAGDSDVGSGHPFAVARLHPGGSLDGSFSSDGRRLVEFRSSNAYDVAVALAIQRDGKIVLAGESHQGSLADQDFALARLHPEGTLDGSFSGDGKRTFGFLNATPNDVGALDRAGDVGIQPDGKIVMVGWSEQGSDHQFAVARVLPGGGLDQSFSGDGRRTFILGTGRIAEAAGVALRNERIVVAGLATGPHNRDFAVARLLGE